MHFCQPSGRDRLDAMHGRGKELASRFQYLRRELWRADEDLVKKPVLGKDDEGVNNDVSRDVWKNKGIRSNRTYN